MNAPSLTVVMPAFNEEKNLDLAVTRTLETLNALDMDHELIIVDDASRDTTAMVAQRLSARYPAVRVLRHDINQGIGRAFVTGAQQAARDYVILIPADNPFDVDDLRPFVQAMGKDDIIAGVRDQREGYSAGLAFLSWAYNRVLVPVLFGLKLRDVNWIQAYRRKIFQDGRITVEYPGVFFFVEILVKASRLGYTIGEVPARMKKRIHGRPTISRLPVILKTLRDALHFFFRLRFGTLK